jgi:hypothetical protein
LKGLRELLVDSEKIKRHLEQCSEDEKVILRCGEYYRTIEKETMQWTDEEGTSHIIGVF